VRGENTKEETVAQTWSRRAFLKLGGAGVAAIPLLGSALSWDTEAFAAPTANHAHLGGFAEPATGGNYFKAFVEYQNDLGRGADIYRTYRSWGQRILNGTTAAILSPQKNPYPPPKLYISFHAFYDSKGNNCIPWADIAAGKYDGEIDSWSAELLKIGKPAYVVFHHEMENEEGGLPGGCGTPKDFQAAYWYFRRRMAVVNGVPDLTWVITFMHNTFAPYLKHGGPARWWPSGSPYGDVPDDHLMGVDIYNRNVCHDKGWRSFMDLMNPRLQSPRKRALTAYKFARGVDRRIFIGECGCVEGDECGGQLPHGTAKAHWFQQAGAHMETWGNLEAFCYSNVTGYSDADYRIGSSPQALEAFQALAADTYFN
jgi:hypothetical protein